MHMSHCIVSKSLGYFLDWLLMWECATTVSISIPHYVALIFTRKPASQAIKKQVYKYPSSMVSTSVFTYRFMPRVAFGYNNYYRYKQ